MAGYWPLAFNEFKFLVQKLMGKETLANIQPGAELAKGCWGCAPPPPPHHPRGRWRPKRHFYTIALTLCSPLHSYKKSAVSFEMYFQQFTTCYCLAKSLLIRIRFWNLFTSPVSYSFVVHTPPLRKILDPPLLSNAWSVTRTSVWNHTVRSVAYLIIKEWLKKSWCWASSSVCLSFIWSYWIKAVYTSFT